MRVLASAYEFTLCQFHCNRRNGKPFLIWLNTKSGHVIKYCVPNTTFYSAFDAINYLDSLWFFNAEFMNIKN